MVSLIGHLLYISTSNSIFLFSILYSLFSILYSLLDICPKIAFVLTVPRDFAIGHLSNFSVLLYLYLSLYLSLYFSLYLSLYLSLSLSLVEISPFLWWRFLQLALFCCHRYLTDCISSSYFRYISIDNISIDNISIDSV